MKKNKTAIITYLIYFSLVSFATVILYSIFSFKEPDCKSLPPREAQKVKTEKISISLEETVLNRIDELPFLYKDIVKAQCLLESGLLESDVFLKNNNLFGMRHPGQRITLSRRKRNGYAAYDNVEASIIDRLLFESRYMQGKSRKEYFKYLDEAYSGGLGKDYSNTLKSIIKARKL